MSRDGIEDRIRNMPQGDFDRLCDNIPAPDQAQHLTKGVLSGVSQANVRGSESTQSTYQPDGLGGFGGFVGFVSIDRFENSDPDLPQFDVAALPKPIADYVTALAEFSQTAIEMSGSLALSLLSAILQRAFAVAVRGNWVETLSLYMIAIADSGSRKSGVINPLFAPLRRYEHKRREDTATAVEMNNQEYDLLKHRIEALKRQITNPPKQKRATDQQPDQSQLEDQLTEAVDQLAHFQRKYSPRLIAGDVTYEKLTQLMSQNDDTMAIVSPEATLLTELRGGKYSDTAGGELDLYLRAHDGEEIYIDRLSRESIDLREPHLSVSICAQPKAVAAFVNDEAMRDRGAVARFLYAPAYVHTLTGNIDGNPPPIPIAITEQFNVYCDQLLDLACSACSDPDRHMLRLSKQADDLLTQYIVAIDRRMPDDLHELQDIASKLHGTAIRIAGLLHVAQLVADGITDPDEICDTRISAATFDAATRLCNYFLEAAKLIVLPATPDQDRIDCQYILAKLPTDGSAITLRDLYRRCSRFDRKRSRFDDLCNQLVRRRYIKIAKVATSKAGGRPADMVFTNPYYLTMLRSDNQKI